MMGLGSPVVREHGPNHRCPIGTECPFRFIYGDTTIHDPVLIPLLERLHEENEHGTIHLPAGYHALMHVLPTIRQMLQEAERREPVVKKQSFGWGGWSQSGG